MDPFRDPEPSSTEPESNVYNDNNGDFEKVDTDIFPQFGSGEVMNSGPEVDQNQEHEVSTTAYGGEEAEEDRYFSGTAGADLRHDVDNLLNFDDSEAMAAQPSAPMAPDVGLGLGGSDSHFSPPPPYSAADHLSEFASKQAFSDFAPADTKENLLKDVEGPSSGMSGCTFIKNLDPRVLDLIYWRDVRKTGVVFGTMLFLLLSLVCCSLMSVTAYLSLALLTITLSFRVYKNLIQAVQKSGDQHPFKPYLDVNIAIPEDRAQEAVDTILKHVNRTSHELRRLFLIEDIVDSIKFGLLLWVMTYIGAWFSGMTLVILTVVSVFTIPKFYETYKTQIDNYVDLVRKQVNKVISQIQEKVPMLKKKTKTQ